MSFPVFNQIESSLSIPPQIIIWIHGTRTHGIFPPTHVVKKENKNKKAPANPHRAIAYSPIGLHSLLALDQDLHVSAIARALHETNHYLCDQEHIYLFGWTGDFSPEARTIAGLHLYQELKKLTELYIKKYNVCPSIIIVTHSHGGNVALESSTISDNSFSVEKLILLACPVQEKTKPYTQSPLFKSIYSIHSDKDYFQILDMQGLHPIWTAFEGALKSSSLTPIKNAWREHSRSTKLLSERHFPQQSNLKQACVEWKKDTIKWSTKDLCIMEPFLSKNSIQKLQIKLQSYDKKERGLMHIEFLFPTFLQQLPYILQTLDATPISTDAKSSPSIGISL
ncbi:MAG: hypothetical protein NT124_04730 [Candidatus Dependentiae bacterium]|nr:hypothetical protein [Candidatus Dependentiae bacterium]